MERQGGAERDDGITLGESGAEERREGAMGDGGREGIDGKAAAAGVGIGSEDFMGPVFFFFFF